jgi:hypothetical protein
MEEDLLVMLVILNETIIVLESGNVTLAMVCRAAEEHAEVDGRLFLCRLLFTNLKLHLNIRTEMSYLFSTLKNN